MARKGLYTKTKTPGIYYNNDTGKYDVKYNYKSYDPVSKKNKYHSKWKTGINTINEAKKVLYEFSNKKDELKDKDITLKGALDLWKLKANAQNYSPSSLKNTNESFKMMTKYIDENTKIKDITEDTYLKLFDDLRNKQKYSEETLHTINATFRKLINLVYKKRLISENPLHRCDSIKTKKSNKKEPIEYYDFMLIDNYFASHYFVRLGEDCYPRIRLLYNILYYCGLRLGEALALTYADFEGDTFRGYTLNVNKTYLSQWKITKEPKNIKCRKIPVCHNLANRFDDYYDPTSDINKNEKMFKFTHANCQHFLDKACKYLGLPHYTSHQFRHTFISNLINQNVPISIIEKVSGDTQETILKTYSHSFENYEKIILNALDNLSDVTK